MNERESAPRKVYLQPEDFLGIITARHLRIVLAHQEEAFKNGDFVSKPLPPTKSKRLAATFEDFAENREIYDDYEHIESLIEGDEIIQSLQPTDPSRDTKPEQSRAIRIRSSVIAARCIIMDQLVELPSEVLEEIGEATIESRVA